MGDNTEAYTATGHGCLKVKRFKDCHYISLLYEFLIVLNAMV